MNFLLFISDYIIPFVIFYVVGYGLLERCDVYHSFIEGASEGFKVVLGILPTLIALMIGVGILRASGALNMLGKLIEPITSIIRFPAELVPLVSIKMFSSSAATSLLLDIYKQYGTDSYLGTLGSVLMSCSETIFYTMSVYFMTAGVKKSRYTLTGALVATLAGIIASVILVGFIM